MDEFIEELFMQEPDEGPDAPDGEAGKLGGDEDELGGDDDGEELDKELGGDEELGDDDGEELGDGDEDEDEDEELGEEEVRAILIVPPEDRVTSNMMTLAEAARTIALMANLVSRYPRTYSNDTTMSHTTNPIEIAKHMLFGRQMPFKIHRQVGTSEKGERIMEEWNVREMAYPSLE